MPEAISCGHRMGSVGGQDDLRGFHLHLETDPSSFQTMDPFDLLGKVHHGLDLRHRGDLRKGQAQAFGKRPVFQQPGDEQVQGADAPAPGGGLEAFEADTDAGRSLASGYRRGHRIGCSDDCCVLLGIRAVAVAVLEIEAQIFDGFACQLRGDQLAQALGLGQVQLRGELGQACGVARGGQGVGTPGGRQIRGVLVPWDVHGVDRLAGSGFSRVGGFQQPVGGCQLGFYAGKRRLIEGAAHGLVTYSFSKSS